MWAVTDLMSKTQAERSRGKVLFTIYQIFIGLGAKGELKHTYFL